MFHRRFLLSWCGAGLVASAALGIRAAEPAGYYNATAGLTGTPLRNAIHTILRAGHVALSYTDTRVALEAVDQDPANSVNVLLIYSGESKPKADWINNNSADGWNREHVWPNSLGINDGLPAYSDIFNLRPCDEHVNSDRGNLYFDESSTGSGYQNPAHAEATGCTQDSDSWEPPLDMKGDIARAMFYMDLRYEGSGEPNLQLTDNTGLISTNSAYMGRLSTLLVWHFLDPVSNIERQRSDAAYTRQGNRSPMVDRPEWVEAIYGAVFTLTASVSQGNVTLTWPAILPDAMKVLETSVDLVSWTPLSVTPTTQGSVKNATVTQPAWRAFYRLRLQPTAG